MQLQSCRGNTFMSYLDKLYKMQNKFVIIIARVRPRTHSEPLFKQCEILNIVEINKSLIGKFMYHVHNKSTLDVSIAMFADMIMDNLIIITYHWYIKSSVNPVLRTKMQLYGIIYWADVYIPMKWNARSWKDLKSQIMCGTLWGDINTLRSEVYG